MLLNTHCDPKLQVQLTMELIDCHWSTKRILLNFHSRSYCQNLGYVFHFNKCKDLIMFSNTYCHPKILVLFTMELRNCLSLQFTQVIRSSYCQNLELTFLNVNKLCRQIYKLFRPVESYKQTGIKCVQTGSFGMLLSHKHLWDFGLYLRDIQL